MLVLNVNLRIALDLTKGPRIEEIEFKDIDEIKNCFRNFKDITVDGNTLNKSHIPVGRIIEVEGSDA